MSTPGEAAVEIIVAVLNSVGPGIMELIVKAAASSNLDDNGKAAIAALGVDLKKDEVDIDAVPPLPVPDPKPTAPG